MSAFCQFVYNDYNDIFLKLYLTAIYKISCIFHAVLQDFISKMQLMYSCIVIFNKLKC